MTSIIPYPAETRTLPNGLTVIVVPMPSAGLVAYWSIVRTGSRDEYEEGRSGFAHFFEHMMFRGTERYPADAYNRIVTTIGADANAYTTDDHTAYHLSMAAEDLEQVMELESDRFQHLSYPETAFQTEAGAVYGEYRKTRMEPEFALWEQLVGTAFTRHPYGHTTLGYERDIAIMPTLYDYSRTFFQRYYRPDTTRVAADLFADLAFGETSDAYRRLVLDEQVAEDLDAGASYNRDPGLLEINARIKDATKIDYVLGVIDASIAEYRDRLPDASRLADLKRRLHYGFLMGLQTPDALASRVTPFVALHGDLRGLDRLYETYAAITPADVHDAANRYLQTSRRTVGVLKSRA
jgi:predicted Zn-dependent peptidase